MDWIERNYKMLVWLSAILIILITLMCIEEGYITLPILEYMKELN